MADSRRAFVALHAASAVAALCAAVALPDNAGAPDAIQLLPAGVINTVDGRGPYTADIPALAAAFSDRLPIDENHATDLAGPRGEPAPARGWIVGLEARADGLWAKVEWNESGKALLADKAYRGISPVIAHDASGKITAILRASLVNNPNLRGLAALNAQQTEQAEMDLLSQLRQALGLADDADAAACMAALSRLKESPAAMQSSLAAIALAAGLAKDADGAAVLGAVKALADPAKMVPAAQVAALQAQFTELQTATKKDKAEAFVDGAIKGGRVGLKPLRDHYIARHMADSAAVEKEINAMPELQSGRLIAAIPPTPDKDGKVPLDDRETRIATLLGVDPVKYAATKAKIAETATAL
jgi:phage I-like protein